MVNRNNNNNTYLYNPFHEKVYQREFLSHTRCKHCQIRPYIVQSVFQGNLLLLTYLEKRLLTNDFQCPLLL